MEGVKRRWGRNFNPKEVRKWGGGQGEEKRKGNTNIKHSKIRNKSKFICNLIYMYSIHVNRLKFQLKNKDSQISK